MSKDNKDDPDDDVDPPIGRPSIRVAMIRSSIGATNKQKANLIGLGLRRIGHVVEREDTPEVRGMVRKISHLTKIIDDEEA